MRTRDNSFTLTASNLWNSLPKHIRNISGKSVECFKRKLDNVLEHYPDIPRCSASGRLKDKHGRNSNSLYDLYKNNEIRKLVDESENVSKGGLPRWPCSS